MEEGESLASCKEGISYRNDFANLKQNAHTGATRGQAVIALYIVE